jgi:hypothetical protein
MCLSSLTKTDKTIIEGYKIFIKSEASGLIQPLMHIKEDTRDPITGKITLIRKDRDIVPVGIWLKATRQKLKTSKQEKYYWSGFHFFESAKDAKRYQKEHRILFNMSSWFGEPDIRKIEVKEMVASGFQIYVKCHVARYMRIIC